MLRHHQYEYSFTFVISMVLLFYLLYHEVMAFTRHYHEAMVLIGHYHLSMVLIIFALFNASQYIIYTIVVLVPSSWEVLVLLYVISLSFSLDCIHIPYSWHSLFHRSLKFH